MVIGGTIFPHKRIHKATWISPDHTTENRIDHICTNKKFRRTTGDVRTRRWADIASHHHLVVANLKLKLKKNWTNCTTKIQYILPSRYQQNQRIQDTSQQQVPSLTGSTRERRNYYGGQLVRYQKALASTCKDVLGLKKHHHKEWISMETLNRIKERNNKKAAINNSRTRTEKVQAQAEYIDANKQMGRVFEKLLNRPAPMNPSDIEAAYTDLPIDVNPPTTEEIRMAVRQIKSWKAAGPHNIPAEALKSDIEVNTNMLHLLFRKIWEEEHVPMNWKEGHLIKVPKRGDPSKYENCQYQGKFLTVLLNRMKDAVDAQLQDQKAGFHKDRSCTDQIVTLRIIVEQSVEWNSSLYINFIDYETAFDSVDRRTLWRLLRHYGVPEKIINIIQNS
ncbi:unnamed protein product [Schistosoma curassoni]|uniref:Uncharacterized protein n=1 Tax=Schistosoma curassoni TaxID=6186 RepID=A0A3P8E839_9TREM|nr:unnamed protein product [Schistosoma curassoni]